MVLAYDIEIACYQSSLILIVFVIFKSIFALTQLRKDGSQILVATQDPHDLNASLHWAIEDEIAIDWKASQRWHQVMPKSTHFGELRQDAAFLRHFIQKSECCLYALCRNVALDVLQLFAGSASKAVFAHIGSKRLASTLRRVPA